MRKPKSVNVLSQWSKTINNLFIYNIYMIILITPKCKFEVTIMTFICDVIILFSHTSNMNKLLFVSIYRGDSETVILWLFRKPKYLNSFPHWPQRIDKPSICNKYMIILTTSDCIIEVTMITFPCDVTKWLLIQLQSVTLKSH